MIRRFQPAAAILVPSALAAVLVVSSGSWLMAKKVVATLLMPAGIIWLALLAVVFWPGIGKSLRMTFLGIWLTYSLAGNVWFGTSLFYQLEKPFYKSGQAEAGENYEAVFVLGGGTVKMGDGRAGLGPSGDRVLVAARLYLQGRTPVLVASGQSVTEVDAARSLAAETKEIWMDLGIPEEAIIELADPRNTREEIAAYAILCREKSWTGAGMVSSAWHLPRVMAEAKSEGLTVIPIPADFRSRKLPAAPLFAIPQASGFHSVQTALWEFLGRLEG